MIKFLSTHAAFSGWHQRRSANRWRVTVVPGYGSGSDSIDAAEPIILPFKEVIDNSGFTAEADDYCGERF